MEAILRKSCVLIFFISGMTCITGQVVTADFANLNKLGKTDSLSEENFNHIIELLNKFIIDYQKASSLIEKDSGIMTSASVKKFQNMFTIDGILVKDFERKISTERVHIKDYINTVVNLMFNGGVNSRLDSADLLYISETEDGIFYKIELEVIKTYFNFVKKGKVIGEPNGREVNFIFTLYLPKQNDIVKLSSIELNNRENRGILPSVKDIIKYFGPSFGGVFPVSSSSYSQYWLENHSDAMLKFSVQPSGSVGVELTSNEYLPKSWSENLFFSAGLFCTAERMRTKLDGLNISSFETVTSTGFEYLRIAQNISLEESATIFRAELPIGLSYRMSSNKRTNIFLSGRVVPGYSFLDHISYFGSGTYDAYVEEANWRALEDGALDQRLLAESQLLAVLDLGQSKMLTGNPSLTLNAFTLGVQFSSGVYIGLPNSDWSVWMAIEANYRFQSSVQRNSPTGDIFKFSDDYPYSASEQYIDSVTLFTPGIRFGIHKKITKQGNAN